MTALLTGPLTGRKVLAIFTLLFGTIIAVNLTLAFNAVQTFPGLETKNSYVASQKFDAERAAQQALGWQVAAHVEGGILILDLRDAQGGAVGTADITLTLGRATNVADDQTPALTFDGTVWRAPVDVAPGNWDIRMVATAEDGTTFRRRIKLGRIQ